MRSELANLMLHAVHPQLGRWKLATTGYLRAGMESFAGYLYQFLHLPEATSNIILLLPS